MNKRSKRWGLYSQPDVTSKVCSGCGLDLPIDRFRVRKKKSRDGTKEYPYYNPDCHSCETERRRAYRQTDHYRAKRKAWREENRGDVRVFIQCRIAGWRAKEGIPSDLTTDYLVDLYREQHGECYYFGTPVEFNSREKPNRNTMSLDRLDPEQGYTQGNVVWCSYLANTMKQQMSEQEFYETLELILARSRER